MAPPLKYLSSTHCCHSKIEGAWRILGLPKLPNIYRNYSVISQYEKPLAELPEFLVDPAQRILVLASQDSQAFVIPVELFLQRVHSVRADPYIPWDEWAGDVTTVHLHPGARTLQLFDTKLLALSCQLSRQGGWGVWMYDLSKSGQRDTQIQQEGPGEGERILSTPKWFARCPRGPMGYGIPCETKLVGNKVISIYVNPLFLQTYSCHV